MTADDERGLSSWVDNCDIPAPMISFLYRTIQIRFSQELVPFNIGWGHFTILKSLYYREGRSQDELARSHGFDKTMISKSIVRLEREGLVYRVVDPADKRVKRLYLTQKGRGIEPDLVRIGNEVNAMLVDGLSGGDREELIGMLRKVSSNAAGTFGANSVKEMSDNLK
ncbi:MarR family winged helix-turn-helix transcriptional regulator [Methanolacinia paynteri]|uniref:MarR family winged helix-turn-helix transcriptional regulator n=1 Tax=Methanolacinia paynteri TaxID=230356 RepID=UPI00064EA496|nr:MarR family winged helix-turn-helix transcriptional regulator [Methanolacinia paynteri]